MENFGGEIVFKGFPKDEFGLATAHFVIGAEGEGVGDEVWIEKGNAHLERVGHARAIDFGQDALLQIKFGAKVEDAFEPAGKATAVNEAGDIFKGIVALELVAGVGGEEVVPLAVAAGTHPKEKTNFSGQAESFEELGEEEREAFVIVGDGQALDEVVNSDANPDGKEGEALDKEMGLKAGVTGEKFVPAISTEDGFDFSSGELGQEPCWHEGGIAEGFVEAAVNGGKRLGDIFGREGLVVVFGTDLAGDHFGEGKLIIGGLLKANGEGVEFFLGEGGGEGGDGAGVDPTAEENADFDITAELVADGFLQKFAGGASGFIEGAGADGVVFDGEVVKIFGATAGGR